MLSGDYISHADYITLKNVIIQPERKLVEDVENLIRSTTNYVIEQDKRKLDTLIDKFKGYEKYEALESLIDKILNGYEKVDIDEDDAMRALENSSFPKTKVLEFKMLLRSMQRKRERIKVSYVG